MPKMEHLSRHAKKQNEHGKLTTRAKASDASIRSKPKDPEQQSAALRPVLQRLAALQRQLHRGQEAAGREQAARRLVALDPKQLLGRAWQRPEQRPHLEVRFEAVLAALPATSRISASP